MSQPNSVATTEKTFSAYNQSQGQAYAQIRRDYHTSVYQTVLTQHTSTGGQLSALLDIGCGPGLATSALAPHFTSAIGLDPSAGMIAAARSLSSSDGANLTSTSQPIRYEISTAELLGTDLSPPITASSIDLITAANAAHWFPMAEFWARAAEVLKPGGSVALWTSGELLTHPSMPNAAKIQAAMDNIQSQHLEPYTVPGNIMTRNRYVDLPLPWTLAEPVREFDEASFFRREWAIGEPFFVGESEADLDTFELMMGTSSSVTRWRQAHQDKVGTEGDVVRILRREMERLLREEGVEEEGKMKVRGTARGVVLVVKKKIDV